MDNVIDITPRIYERKIQNYIDKFNTLYRDGKRMEAGILIVELPFDIREEVKRRLRDLKKK